MALIPENVRIRLPRGEWFFNPARPLGPPGGFGEVFEGRDAEDQPVAVKRLKLTVGEAAHRDPLGTLRRDAVLLHRLR